MSNRRSRRKPSAARRPASVLHRLPGAEASGVAVSRRAGLAPAGNPLSGDTSRPLAVGETTVLAVILAAIFFWCYWPVLVDLVRAWDHQPDYSHGYLVVPIAGYFLWTRRERRPRVSRRYAWIGLVVVCLAVAGRVAGALWYVDAVQGWSIPLWVAGAGWFLGGWPLVRWSLPAVLFLGFMIPLPYGAERLLSLPLQQAATQLSCFLLQCLGQPAIAEGNVVLLNDLQLEVAQACSGLRIFVSIVALAFAFSVLISKPWWIKAGLFLAIVPIALLVNALRIAATGLLHIFISGEVAQSFSHDAAGWLMLPVAAALMGAWIWYLGRLILEVETVSAGELLAPNPATAPAHG